MAPLVILLRREEILRYLAMSDKVTIEDWKKIVRISPDSESFYGKDSWILESNCLHLAANFFTQGLHILLSNLSNENKEKLIQETHSDDSKNPLNSPLHLAACQNDSLGARYSWGIKSLTNPLCME